MPLDLDLRHVISPAVRDLIELANLDDFDRARDQITRLRGCTRPINLVGQTTTRNAITGETIRSYSTSDEPTGRLLTTCGNRRTSRCPACSRTYAADTYHLVRAGLCGGKDVSETVRTHPASSSPSPPRPSAPSTTAPPRTASPTPAAAATTTPRKLPNSARR